MWNLEPESSYSSRGVDRTIVGAQLRRGSEGRVYLHSYTMVIINKRRRPHLHQHEKLAHYVSLIACLACVTLLLRLSASFLNNSLHEPAVSLDIANSAELNANDLSHANVREANLKHHDVISTTGKTFGSSDQVVDGRGEWLLRVGQKEPEIISRVAFGSCSSRKAIYQPIWLQGIVPSSPQAWIWFVHLFQVTDSSLTAVMDNAF